MATEKTVISPRLENPMTIEYYRQNYKSLNAGAEMALAYYPELRKEAMHQMKGMFEANEVKLMLDLMNGTMLNPVWLHNKAIIFEIQDGIRLDGVDQKCEVDGQKLIKKLEGLNLFQCWFLTEWLFCFWYSNPNIAGIKSAEELEKYIACLI